MERGFFFFFSFLPPRVWLPPNHHLAQSLGTGRVARHTVFLKQRRELLGEVAWHGGHLPSQGRRAPAAMEGVAESRRPSTSGRRRGSEAGGVLGELPSSAGGRRDPAAGKAGPAGTGRALIGQAGGGAVEGAGTSGVGGTLRQGRRGRQAQGEPSLGRLEAGTPEWAGP